MGIEPERQLIADRWELIEVAGRGGAGVVYRARDRAHPDAPEVALKLLDTSAQRERFEREVRLLAELDHPHIVRHLAHGHHRDAPFLVTEWLGGETLKHRLDRARPTLDEVVAMARAVASALAAIHARGIVHRDLKPSNLFLPDGDPARVKLLDFGVAHVATDDLTLTRTGALIGTPSFMSPEQAQGATIDSRSDLFSLGTVLFVALTGENPFHGADYLAVLTRLLVDEIPRAGQRAPGVPDWLDQLIFRLHARDPRDRPADGDALARELAGAAAVAPPAFAAPAPLSHEERRILSIVRVAQPTAPAAGEATWSRASAASSALDDSALASLALRYGGRVERIGDADPLITFGQGGSAADRAMQAVRCALALGDELTPAPAAIFVATGTGLVTPSLTIGDVITRVHATPLSTGHGVTVDTATERLLDGRFHLRGEVEPRRCVAFVEAPTGDTPSRRDSAFVGRHAQVRSLRMLIDEACEAAAARSVLLLGEAGSGKSRLVQELLAGLSGEVVIWRARADVNRRSSPFSLLAGLVRSALGLAQPRPPPPVIEDAVLRLCGDDADDGPGIVRLLLGDEALEAGALVRDPMALAQRRGAFLRRMVRAGARDAALVIVLEDLHWSDAASLSALAELLSLEQAPVLWLATARPEARELVQSSWRHHLAMTLTLQPLSGDAAERLVRDLAPTATPEQVRAIVLTGAGNPFFLEELTRGLLDRHDAAPDATVLMMLQTQLESLHPVARRVLRAGSVFGRRFSLAGASDVAGLAPDAAEPHLARLIAERLLRVEADDAPDSPELIFRHDLIRDAAYAISTERDRRHAHRRAAMFLEAHGEHDAAAIATHFDLAQSPSEAGPRWVLAAEQAQARGDREGAIGCCERALAAGVGGATFGRARLVESWARLIGGEITPSAALAGEALAHLPAHGDDWYRAAGLMGATGVYAGHAEATRALVPAIDRAWPERPTAIELLPASRVVSSLLGVGERVAAEPLIARFTALDPEQHAGTARASIEQTRAFLDLDAGDHAAAARRFLHVADLLFEDGQVTFSVAQRFNGIDELIKVGAWAEAEAAATWRHASGLPGRLALLLDQYAAIAQAYQPGRLAPARAAALATLEHWRVPLVAGQCHVHLAGLTLTAGLGDEALDHAEEACALLDAYPPHRPGALAMRGRIALRRDDLDRAEADTRAAMAALDAIGPRLRRPALVRLARIEVLTARGEHDAARRLLATALTELHAAAARISDATLAASFLHAVPEHRALSALGADPGP